MNGSFGIEMHSVCLMLELPQPFSANLVSSVPCSRPLPRSVFTCAVLYAQRIASIHYCSGVKIVPETGIFLEAKAQASLFPLQFSSEICICVVVLVEVLFSSLTSFGGKGYS